MDNLNIGGVPLKSHAVLAPMAGVSDRAYRELCVRFGAAYCVSEMVSSKALSFNSKKSEELMEISDLERLAEFRFSVMIRNVWLMPQSTHLKTNLILLISIWDALLRR